MKKHSQMSQNILVAFYLLCNQSMIHTEANIVHACEKELILADIILH